MRKIDKLTNKVARIENFFVENAHYILNTREQKLILHLAANLDLKKQDFYEQIVPVKDLEQMLKKGSAKWGGIYKELNELGDKLSLKRIVFPTEVVVDGNSLNGYIPWFSTIAPCYNEKEEVCLKFKFNPELKPFLLKLKQYVRINLLEIAGMDSFYSLRLYQIFKANLAKQDKHLKIISKIYDLKGLRELLGAKSKYGEYKYFNRDILMKATKEINNHTQIFVKYESLRTKRKITHIRFTFCDKRNHKEYKQLSFADCNPSLSDTGLRTPKERKDRQKQFDFKLFKKAYPLVYKKKRQKVLDHFKTLKNVHNKDVLINKSIENQCLSWFLEFG